MNSPLRRARIDSPQTRLPSDRPAFRHRAGARPARRPLFLGHLTEPERMEERRDPFLRAPGRET